MTAEWNPQDVTRDYRRGQHTALNTGNHNNKEKKLSIQDGKKKEKGNWRILEKISNNERKNNDIENRSAVNP